MSNIYRLTAATEHNVGSQFAKSAEARYQDGLDRDDARESAIARVQTELRIAMLAALGGIHQWVPSYSNGVPCADPRENTISVHDAVAEANDHMACAAEMALVLAHSECPLVAKWRKSLADVYARDNAEHIAQARGLI